VFFTDRQLKVLTYVHAYTQEKGVAPTLREIASNFGVTKVTALEHLRALEKKRAIRRHRHQPRSIELVDGPPTHRQPIITLPITGELHADGQVDYANQAPDLDVSSLVPKQKNGHILRVVGNHLARSGLHDGDLLVIEPRATPRTGELVLLALDRSRAIVGRYSDQPHAHVVSIASEGGVATDAVPSQIRGIVQTLIRRFSPPA